MREPKNGFSKGVKKLKGLIDKILSKFRFKKFKIQGKGFHIYIYGEVNPNLTDVIHSVNLALQILQLAVFEQVY
ncbi:hypothetical protein [Clostridium sp. BNL1100]|uniref:hypothetical protein n=1 Tax=Clostridium sp. BNL1100 TaxID=755731 RepID=UPI00031C52D7|nr:hypothetical protein [Clostridium sp. BNL1100]